MSKEDIIAEIVAKGEKIRELKVAKASADEVKAQVDELLELKGKYKELTGEDYIAPGTQGSRKDKKKEKAPTPAAAPEPSKKKQAAKEKEKEKAERVAQEASGDEEGWRYGDYPLIQSQTLSDKRITRIEGLTRARADQTVWVRARVHTTRAVGKGVFLLLRQSFFTVQATLFQNKEGTISKTMVKYAAGINRESVVDIRAVLTVAPQPVESATQSEVELKVEEIHVVSAAEGLLPLLVDDAARPEKEGGGPIEEDGPAEGEDGVAGPTAHQETRLDFRWIDLRTPANQAIFRLESGVCQIFREFMVARNFVEIHSPKLIGGASEGGANVFTLDYFGRPACLAQSPQLYKQMAAACGGFERVFEVAPVFRAENSNTHRHLCEFTGLDFEMTIQEHYFEVLDVLGELFNFMFDELNLRYQRELAAVNVQYPFEPLKYCRPALRLTYREGIQMLQDAGYANASPDEDLSTELEKALGKIVREKFDTDFFMMDKYPLAARPFYTMPCPEDPTRSNSFDLFIRGEEIVSGAQRIHDAALLEERAKHWQIPLHTIAAYIEAFKHGAEPHGGGGIGLERVVMLFLGLKNIRKTSLFPRDPKRLSP